MPWMVSTDDSIIQFIVSKEPSIPRLLYFFHPRYFFYVSLALVRSEHINNYSLKKKIMDIFLGDHDYNKHVWAYKRFLGNLVF